MNLDNEMAILRMLKSEYNSQHYRLEDNLLKYYPVQIVSVTERIEGIEKDIAMYTAEKAKCTEIKTTNGAASVTTNFPGMTINDVFYTEKEPAAKALVEACKGVKGRNVDVPVGEFMGFKLSLSYASFSQQIQLLIRGAMTYQIDLGTDTFGNIQRITNALDKLPSRLEGAKDQLTNLEKQVTAAKEEFAKPFPQENEFQEKEARLALLNADLNIDGDGDFDVINDTDRRDESEQEPDEQDEDSDDERDEQDEPRSAKPYELVGTPPTFNYGEPHTGTYGKSKPSILDDIRSINSNLKPPAQGGSKSTEVYI
jgi:hypothetical protein